MARCKGNQHELAKCQSFGFTRNGPGTLKGGRIYARLQAALRRRTLKNTMKQNDLIQIENVNITSTDQDSPEVFKTYDRRGQLAFQLETTSEAVVLYFPGLDLKISHD